LVQQLLVRHGIVLRETAIAEDVPRGFPTIYPALKTMEDAGWVRRGMFVAGLGAAQFAMPAAVDMIRSLRSEQEKLEVLFLAATDPANPYGASLPWPRRSNPAPTTKGPDQIPDQPDEASTTDNGNLARPMSRASGGGVILINGNLTAFLRRKNQDIQVFLPESEPDRSRFGRELAKKLAEIAIRRQGRKTGLLLGTINGEPARDHLLARFLEESGFLSTAVGFQMRRIIPTAIPGEAAPGTIASDDAENEEPDSDVVEST
jgi:ATP-dependent Lhr-like helicase